MRWTPAPWERWRGSAAGERGQRYAVAESCLALCLRLHCSPGDFGMPSGSRSTCPALPQALVSQADNPRGRVVYHDDSIVCSCSYSYITLLGGMRWWVQRARLAHPLHSVDGQSWPWGVCIILASWREASHLYSLQVIKDLAVSTPYPWLCGHFEGMDRRDPLNVGLHTTHGSWRHGPPPGWPFVRILPRLRQP
jgi:hypothetical protein